MMSIFVLESALLLCCRIIPCMLFTVGGFDAIRLALFGGIVYGYDEMGDTLGTEELTKGPATKIRLFSD